jgi:methylthioribose-1-phosphate isomerase
LFDRIPLAFGARGILLKPLHSFLDSRVRPIKLENGRVLLIDQRLLPERVEIFDATALDAMCFAIRDMVVRGAPAIGVAAALGLANEAGRLARGNGDKQSFLRSLASARDELQATRPTAVNLRWATNVLFDLAQNSEGSPQEISERLMAEAEKMIQDDIDINVRIGENGAPLLKDVHSILTHCNAGALATCGWGTALGVIRSAVGSGQNLKVYVDETRPRQQGARLTVWELMQDGIKPTLITDNMAGYLMAQGKIESVITGADRIATNGDTANKIGTYSVAVLCKAHNIPFYIAAPISTIDPQIKDGSQIPIEERHADEVIKINDRYICQTDVEVYNPSFDVTPANLISAIITECGILHPPYESSIKDALSKKPSG